MSHTNPTYDDSNIFAQILKGDLPAHVIFEDDKTLAILDIMPDAKGHALVIPKIKARELADLPAIYGTAVLETAKKVMAAQRKVLGAAGIVALQLNGADAGQSVAHYHLHLIPTHIHNISNTPNNKADKQALTELAKILKAAIDDPVAA